VQHCLCAGGRPRRLCTHQSAGRHPALEPRAVGRCDRGLAVSGRGASSCPCLGRVTTDPSWQAFGRRHSQRGAHLCGSRGRRRRPHAGRRRRLERAAAGEAAAHGAERVRGGRADRRAGQRRARRRARAQALRAQAGLALGRGRERAGQALAQALAVALCARARGRHGAALRARARARAGLRAAPAACPAHMRAASRPCAPVRHPPGVCRNPPARSSAQDPHSGPAHAVPQAASCRCLSLVCEAGHVDTWTSTCCAPKPPAADASASCVRQAMWTCGPAHAVPPSRQLQMPQPRV